MAKLLNIWCIILVACSSTGSSEKSGEFFREIVQEATEIRSAQPDSLRFKMLFDNNPGYMADGFDYPVGYPDAKGYYNAQEFGENYHLGEDWNVNTGGNSDLGDPIFAIANGYIREVKDHGGGWGWVIRMLHLNKDSSMVESLYSHCDTVLVREGQWVKKGVQIATIGNAHGSYLAHLHFEMRSDITLPLGGGYGRETKGFMVPTWYIKRNRGISNE
jgi:murein DD-endopeptidase MepM/ murein hydrolase activator NlpD